MNVRYRYVTLLLFLLFPVHSAFADNPDIFTAGNASAEEAQIPVLKHPVRAGETITAEDIDFKKEPARQAYGNIIIDSKDLIGKAPKRTIAQGRPIRQDEISNPAILLKGARVTMIYRSNNLEIRTLGEALDSGAKGDVIRVKNLASKTIVDGVVESGNIVHTSSPESNAAEAM